MISAVVLTKNEEKNIQTCLDSLKFCDEIIVLDDHSTDNTVDIAKRMTPHVYTRSLDNDFASQRNFGLEKAKGDWVLFIDADERVSPALWYEIMQHTNNPTNPYTGFYFKRNDVLWGKELHHGEIGKVRLLRLAKKHAGTWRGKVHETWKNSGKTLLLKNAILHYPHQTIAEFLQEINYYSDLRAEELFEKKVKSFWLPIFVYPKAKFLMNFIFRRGFLDGLEGFVFALMMSFHSFLVRGKLWLHWQKNRKKQTSTH